MLGAFGKFESMELAEILLEDPRAEGTKAALISSMLLFGSSPYRERSPR